MSRTTVTNALTATVIASLRQLGWKAWRNNRGVMRAQNRSGGTRFVSFGGEAGAADVFAIRPGGQFVAIEIKTGRDELSTAQSAWLDEVNALGGLAYVVRNEDDLEMIINRVRMAAAIATAKVLAR